MKYILALLLLTSCAPVSTKNWRTRDTLAESALFAVTIYDWNQTVAITRNCSESNPIIGACGEKVNMHLYFTTVLLSEMVISRLLPQEWRSVFQSAWIGAETATVIDNHLP